MFYKIFLILIVSLTLAGSTTALAVTADIGAPVVQQFQSFTQTRQGFIGFLSWLFPVMLSVATIAAVISLIFAGFQWMAGSISPPQVEAAQTRIWAAVSGLALALGSWLIVNTINPDLIKLRAPTSTFNLEVKCPPEGCPTWDSILLGVETRYATKDEAWADARNNVENNLKKIPGVTDEEAKSSADKIEFIACANEANLSTPTQKCQKLLEEGCKKGKSTLTPDKNSWNCTEAITNLQKEKDPALEKLKQAGWVCQKTRSTSSFFSNYIGSYAGYLNEFVGCK